MIRHTLLLIIRNFKRFKGTFLINMVGLSSGLACTLLIYLWVSDEMSVDTFHKNDCRLFQVMTHKKHTDGIESGPSTPAILAETMALEIPEIETAAASVENQQNLDFSLSTNEVHVRAKAQFISKDYFKIFSYDFIAGNKDQVIADKKSVVISNELALKLFSTTVDVIGKTVVWDFQGEKMSFEVTGIFRKLPSNASDQFDFAMSYELFKDFLGDAIQWGNFGSNSYVLLKEGTDVEKLNEKIAGFIKTKDKDTIFTLFLKRYSENYLYGRYENGVLAGGRIEYVGLFSIIALFILMLACINFMNLSTAKALRRIKEVGIKKAIGAGRRTLIIQYLGESMTLVFLAMIVSVLLVDLLLPQFNDLTGKDLHMEWNVKLVLSCLGIGVFTGLVAGSYPAFYLSGFNPAAVLKGKFNTSIGELWARKGLVVFQFTLSVVFIVCVLVIYKQVTFVQDKNLGYDKDNIIYFTPEGKAAESTEAFLVEMRKVPGIINASSTAHSLVKRENYTTGFEWEGKNPEDVIPFEMVYVNYDMIETLGIKMVAGRTYSPDYADEKSKIIFNEAAIKVMGLQDPIGKKVKMWGSDVEIIGITKDFHFESLHNEVKPLFFKYEPGNSLLRAVARIEAGKERETIDRLQELYKTFNPGFTFDYQFMDQEYQAQYVAETRVAVLSRYFAGLAILISSLGLLGLAAFTSERRRKEIGIRKVLGSSSLGIVTLLSADFAKMVLLSVIIGLPVSYFIAYSWLSSFAYKIEMEWWFFIGAGLLALAIACLTVGSQALRAARVNPTQCLKEE